MHALHCTFVEDETEDQESSCSMQDKKDGLTDSVKWLADWGLNHVEFMLGTFWKRRQCQGWLDELISKVQEAASSFLGSHFCWPFSTIVKSRSLYRFLNDELRTAHTDEGLSFALCTDLLGAVLPASL